MVFERLKEGYHAVKRLLDGSPSDESDSLQTLAQELYDGERLQGAYNTGVQLAALRHPLRFRELKKRNETAWSAYAKSDLGAVGGLLPLSLEVGFLTTLYGAKGRHIPGASIVETVTEEPAAPELKAESLEAVMATPTEEVTTSRSGPKGFGELIAAGSKLNEYGRARELADIKQRERENTIHMDQGEIPDSGLPLAVAQIYRESMTRPRSQNIHTSQWFNWGKFRMETDLYRVDPKTEHVTYLGNRRDVGHKYGMSNTGSGRMFATASELKAQRKAKAAKMGRISLYQRAKQRVGRAVKRLDYAERLGERLERIDVELGKLMKVLKLKSATSPAT